MALRLYSEFNSSTDKLFKIEIHDTSFTGTAESFPVASNGFELNYSGETDDIVSPIIGSNCTISAFNTSAAFDSFISALKGYQESRFFIRIYAEAATIEELEGFFEKKEKEQSSPEVIVEEAEIQSDIEKEKVLVDEEKKPQVETVVSIEEDHTKEEVKKKTEEESTEKLGLGLYDDYNLVPINFFDSINICFTKFFNFKDRASRSEYWWFYLFFWVVIFLAAFSESFKDSYLSILFGLVILIAWIPLISVSVRRLHDVNKSGWYFFIGIIPYLGPLFFLFFTLEKGTLGNNNYGKFPLQFKDPNLRDNSDEIQSDSYSNEDSSENLMDNISQNRADRAEREAQATTLRNSKEYILRKKEKQKKEWIIAGSILFLIIIFLLLN